MDYQTMQRMEELMHFQIKFIDYMDVLIKFDEDFTSKNPNEELPPVVNIGVLKSHFITQKKACEGVLSITARHMPRLKAEYEKNKKIPNVKHRAVVSAPKRKQVPPAIVSEPKQALDALISLF